MDKQALSDITVFNKYAKFNNELNRRENWTEIVKRNAQMHKTKYPHMAEQIDYVYDNFVHTKRVLPSMRSLQFGGRPILMAENRIFNCAYAPAESVKFFSELMFLLLGGTGMGYSVQERHISKLPKIKAPESDSEYKFQVQDSIVGWADSVKVVCKAFFNAGTLPIFDYRDIREKGSELVTTGGQAPGPEPLRICIEKLINMFRKAIGRKLRSIEVHDMACVIADAVLAGGIRRAAMISLFDRDDEEMLSCKSGEWYIDHPYRARSNNSAVLPRGKVSQNEFFALMKRVEESGCGEPGVYWTNNEDWGTNPCCVTSDSFIQTSDGIKQVSELINKPFIANVSGNNYLSKTGFWSTGVKPVFSLTTEHGTRIKATGNHRILMKDGGWINLEDISIGDSICHSISNPYDKSDIKEFDKGWVLGEIVGDGGFNPAKYDTYLRFWGEYKEEMATRALNIINDQFKVPNDRYKLELRKVNEKSNSITVSSKTLNEFADCFIEQGSKELKPVLLSQSKDFLAGFISGFFDADGSVQGNLVKGVSIRLSQVSVKKLELVQQILFSLGIVSKLYKDRAPEGMRILPDGKGGEKEYLCKATNELCISNASFTLFGRTIGLQEPAKQEKFNLIEYSRKRKANRDSLYTKVVNIEYIGIEEVFDCTVEEANRFSSNCLIVHNCEIALRPYQMCNLTEINAGVITDQTSYNDAADAAAFLGTLQAGYTDFHYLNPKWHIACEKDALLGVSMTGIASGTVEKLNMQEAALAAYRSNYSVSEQIGINAAARITCVKPAGTTSLVLGTSSGIHAWHAPYYIRRMRAGKDEALAQYMMKVAPELVEQDTFVPHQVVLSFPQKAPENATVRSESVFDLLDRVRDVSINWVGAGHVDGINQHNVSCTISVQDKEWLGVTEWMWQNREHYNGISVLPYNGGTYVQAPFEDITEEKYNELLPYLKNLDISQVFEENGNSINLKAELACSGGSCELT